jgi:FKBP-type peptidyl-prolyl cis-trans isomerase SlyD
MPSLFQEAPTMSTSPRVVSIHYTLTDDKGTVLDSSQGAEPLQYLEGAGNIIPGLEKAVGLLNVGDKKKIKVAAAQAYGEKREDMVLEVPRTQFPPDMQMKVGDRFRGGPDDHAPVFTVMGVEGDKVKLDGNHPLAGQDLTFDVEVTEVRAASSEEVSHGHAHGPHGHHH